MKVLYVLSTLQWSGPVNQLYDLVTNLDGINAEIVTLSTADGSTRRGEFQEEGIEVESLELSRTSTLVSGPRHLARAVEDRDPDVVHSHGIRGDVLSALTIRSIPTATTIHNDPLSDYPLKYGSVQGMAMAKVHSAAFSRIDTAIACSESVADALGGKTMTLRNGVNATRWKPAAKSQQQQARRRLNLPTDEEIFLSVGSFIKRKQPQAIIKGFLRSDAADNGTLVMVGDGPLRDECWAKVSNDESVVFPGFVDSVEPYYDAADYYVSASVAEGLPLGVLEAMASGLPVCLSDIHPHKEILELDGTAGLLFSGCAESTDIEIQTAMSKLLRRDYDEMTEAARAIVSNELNAARMASEYQEVYESMAAGRDQR